VATFFFINSYYYSAGFCFSYNVPKFKMSIFFCEMIPFECFEMFSEADLLWTAINLDPRITFTIRRPAGLIYCWWILFSTFQTLYCVKCHIQLCWGTLRVVSFSSFFLCFCFMLLYYIAIVTTFLLFSVRCLLVRWNVVNLVTNGPQNSGCINRMAVWKGFFKAWFSLVTQA